MYLYVTLMISNNQRFHHIDILKQMQCFKLKKINEIFMNGDLNATHPQNADSVEPFRRAFILIE